MQSAVAARKARLDTGEWWSPNVPPSHSSDDDFDQNPEQSTSFPPRSSTLNHLPLSTWRPVNDENYFELTNDDLACWGISSSLPTRLVLLRKSERLALLGVYSLTAVHGSLSLAGVPIKPQDRTHKVFAPWSSPLPVIECLGRSDARHAVQQPSRLQHVIERADAAVVLQEAKTEIEGLGQVCKTFEGVFEPPRTQPRASQHIGLHGVHYIETESNEVHPFVLSPLWEKTLHSVINRDVNAAGRLVFLVQGAKKSGKSSFARLLLNMLSTKYRKVAFLECDIGQSEFTPGGMVSLNILSRPVFGPPFSHPSIPYRAHYIGSTSPKDSPGFYLEAVGSLVRTYDADVQHGDLSELEHPDTRCADSIPLVINTMGWIQGLGTELSRKIVQVTRPCDVFDFFLPSDETAGHNSPSGLAPNLADSVEYAVKFHALALPSSVRPLSRFSPADHRTIAMLSYFHALFPEAKDGILSSSYATSWNTSSPLCTRVPYEVTARTAFASIVIIGPGSEDIPPSEVPLVLNGAVVGLVSHDSRDAEWSDAQDQPTSLPHTQGSLPPSPSDSTCLGLMLVRSLIGAENTSRALCMHIITPIPLAHLADVCSCILVKGLLELPVWGFLDFRSGPEGSSDNPYLRWGKVEGVGGARRRKNIARRGLH